jgi:hypothetical protein
LMIAGNKEGWGILDWRAHDLAHYHSEHECRGTAGCDGSRASSRGPGVL